jgi:hypothetical protein
MTYLHQRPFTIGGEHSDAGHLAYMASLPEYYTDKILLPMGGSHFQGFSNRCAAAGSFNVLETVDHKYRLETAIPEAEEIYEFAREIDDGGDVETPEGKIRKGTFAEAAADAVCRLMDGSIYWHYLPVEDTNTLANWLAVEQTGILLGSQWTTGHLHPTHRTGVCIPNHETRAPGHAVALNGFIRNYRFRPAFWRKSVTKAVFSFENTHRFSARRWYLEPGAIQAHGIVAIVFKPAKP